MGNDIIVDPDDSALFRREPRAEASFAVTVIVPGNELVADGVAIDLSAGGMRLGMAIDLASGQDVILRLTLPNDWTERMLRGRVVLAFYDATSRMFVHGVAFTQVATDDHDAIAAYVAEQ